MLHDGPIRDLTSKLIEYSEDEDYVLALACAEKLVELLKKRKQVTLYN